jgi:hypothetical protein
MCPGRAGSFRVGARKPERGRLCLPDPGFARLLRYQAAPITLAGHFSGVYRVPL